MRKGNEGLARSKCESSGGATTETMGGGIEGTGDYEERGEKTNRLL